MSNSLSRISDDIDEYLWLCSFYGEPAKFTQTAQGTQLPDCYGKHQRKLWERYQKDTEEGTSIIRDERTRQVQKEKWTPEHDDHHTDGEMLAAAVAYIRYANGSRKAPEWPWEAKWWKPSNDPVRNLAKAGALIAAEIDRLKRAHVAKLKARHKRIAENATA